MRGLPLERLDTEKSLAAIVFVLVVAVIVGMTALGAVAMIAITLGGMHVGIKLFNHFDTRLPDNNWTMGVVVSLMVIIALGWFILFPVVDMWLA